MTGLKLALLGGLEFHASTGTGSQTVSLTRKARGLIAYLAFQQGKPQSREKLADLLWGTSAEEQARANLRQTLSSIRKVLDGHLIADANQISIAPDGFELDVMQFEHLARNGDTSALEQAAALYGGDLLDGFSLKEEAFEAWSRTERERLRSLVIGVLMKLATHYEANNDHEGCVRTANRLLALDPLREDAHRILMRCYSAQGRMSEALKQFEVCRDKLRQELDVSPMAETLALVVDIRGKQTAPVVPGDPGVKALPLPDKPSVAILPFENKSSDPEQDYFADGLTENIITGLTRFHNLFVIAVKSTFKIREKGLDAVSAARELGVAHIVEGSVRKAGNRIRVTAQLVEIATRHRIWAETYDRDLEDYFIIQDEITNMIVATVAGRMEDARRKVAERKDEHEMAAYDFVLRGRQCMNRYTKEADLAARTNFEHALELDPNCATAYAGLAVSYSREIHSPWSIDYDASTNRLYEFAQKAIDLDANDDLALYALSIVYYFRDQYDQANTIIDKAIELNPNNYHHLCAKGWYCTFMGDLDEGLAITTDALRINPYSPDNCRLILGLAHYLARDYEAAIEALCNISIPNHFMMGFLAACYGQLGRAREAHGAMGEFWKLMEIELIDWAVDDSDEEPWRVYWKYLYRFKDPAEFDHLMEGIEKASQSI